MTSRGGVCTGMWLDASGNLTVQRRSQREVLRDWVERHTGVEGLRMQTSAPCCRQLLGKRCRESSQAHDFNCEPHLPPGADHVTAWKAGRNTVAVVIQPYGMSWRSIRALVEFCWLHGLGCSVDLAPPWWYVPEDGRERVLTVVITRDEDDDVHDV